jgi:hypothetical protein
VKVLIHDGTAGEYRKRCVTGQDRGLLNLGVHFSSVICMIFASELLEAQIRGGGWLTSRPRSPSSTVKIQGETMKKTIAILEGDGIGFEIMREAVF